MSGASRPVCTYTLPADRKNDLPHILLKHMAHNPNACPVCGEDPGDGDVPFDAPNRLSAAQDHLLSCVALALHKVRAAIERAVVAEDRGGSDLRWAITRAGEAQDHIVDFHTTIARMTARPKAVA